MYRQARPGGPVLHYGTGRGLLQLAVCANVGQACRTSARTSRPGWGRPVMHYRTGREVLHVSMHANMGQACLTSPRTGRPGWVDLYCSIGPAGYYSSLQCTHI